MQQIADTTLAEPLNSQLADVQKRQGEDAGRRTCRHIAPMMGLVFFVCILIDLGAVNSTPAPATPVMLAAGNETVSPAYADTGGTCFFFGCASDRKALCVVDPAFVSLGGVRVGWAGCRCQSDVPYAWPSDGRCHSAPHEQAAWRGWFRSEGTWAVTCGLAPVLRSGFFSKVQAFLGLDHMIGVRPQGPQYEKIKFKELKSWDATVAALHFEKPWHPYLVAAVKIVGLHCMQPVLFLIPFLGYSNYMGWVQWSCAFCVVMNEVNYLSLTIYALVTDPRLFLYAPLSDESLEPYCFFAGPILWFLQRLNAKEPFASFSACVSLAATLCAWIALLVGISGHGVMWPSLFVGYLFSASEGILIFLFLMVVGVVGAARTM